MKISVGTSTAPDGRVLQVVDLMREEKGKPGAREQLMMQVLDTMEAQVRSALISMGWTPPAAPASPPIGLPITPGPYEPPPPKPAPIIGDAPPLPLKPIIPLLN